MTGKVKLFTHTDLDGVGCAIVGSYAFGRENIDITYCDYHNVNDKVNTFLQEGLYDQYDKIFMTDISIDEATAKLIDELIGSKFKLIDHHKTAMWLTEQYDWALINPYDEFIESALSSGTSMFYDYLIVYQGMINDEYVRTKLGTFSEVVRKYDTWEWFNVYHEELPKILNDFMWLIGREKFYERFMQNPSVEFTDGEKLLIDVNQKSIEDYINRVSKTLVKKDLEGWTAGVVFAEQHTSELGNTLADKNPDCDFIVIINMLSKKIGYRGIRDDIDLGQIAKKLGGGGHPKASGSEISDQIMLDTIENLFDDIYTEMFVKKMNELTKGEVK